jgi:class 3 adenylate cyclase
MADIQNRTLICSVVFIDIVEYSRKPVVEQIELKDRFNGLLSDALRGVAVNDRIILDTGDGAAISFIGDPEDALFVATGLRDDIASHSETAELELSIRMGINLGPVRLVKDINGQPNIIGDGINVAQRVMSFAKPGQVLVSRSYYEVVSRLSDESSRLFSYEGSRTDKHIREHEVYAVGAIAPLHRRVDDTATDSWRGGAERANMLARVMHEVAALAHRAVAKPRIATSLVVAAILVTALGARAYREPPQTVSVRAPEPVAAPDDKLAVATGTATPPPRAAKVVPEAAVVPPSKAAELPPLRGMPDATPPVVVARLEPKRTAPMAEPDRSSPPADDQASPAPNEAAAAVLTLAIAPWGQIYVDGKSRGVSPPLQELELTPGRHRIEVRNAASEPHAITVNAKPGERLRIKHKFN